LSRESGTGSSTRGNPDQAPEVGVGGPFDAGEPGPEGAAPASKPGFGVGDDVLRTAPRPSAGFSLRTALLVMGVLVAMAVVFQLGRDLGRTTEASVTDETPEETIETPGDSTATSSDSSGEVAAPVPDTSVPAPESAMSEHDLAFLSKENNWTVVAISYENSETGGALAVSTYLYLLEQGLPAIKPLTFKGYLMICVGAESTHNAVIEKIRSDLHALDGPPPQNEKNAFGDAYPRNIEDLIDPKLRR
jgi:hypothetical protein